MIWVPNQLLGASINDQVILRCDTEAFPLSLNYWTKENRSSSTKLSDESDHHGEIMIVNSDRYQIANQEQSYQLHMKLVIKRITSDDFGNVIR
ncbi:hypothetical protein BLA29_014316 [Euroglyphus maynei]|uniref:Ig-like domain-containing protein n=1 Tax=Euroglyphus maynei TaxID=6958 RepID=A0A1Y3BDJ2_EURMA|nr:hypothetical protein BLA29_014316 [Euroglyphus maynei]